jgi:hypothetical protein
VGASAVEGFDEMWSRQYRSGFISAFIDCD